MVVSGSSYNWSKVGWKAWLCLTLLVLLLGGCDMTTPKVYRVGVLSGLGYIADITNGLKSGMAELGYVEGENIIYDVQATDFDMAVYRSVLEKFVEDRVDLIFVFPTEATLEAKTATQGTGIPVVFSYVEIEGVELVDSVREPGGNITGVRYPGPDIAVKRFEIMRKIAPEANRMWLPYQRDYPIIESQLDALRPVAETAGVTLIEFPAGDATELKMELDARAQQDDLGIDAILFLSEPLAVTPEPFEVIGRFAYEHGIPVGGALMSVGGYDSIFGVVSNPFESGRLAAPLVDKIFKGMSVSTIPIVSPENFVQINYKAAQAIGVTIPESVLVQADEVIH
ncbi:MAG: ABC transporter substrate-binding protein [Anaerolineae bacterium]|nr:ABC transporter substrate-binding protein [Anaerolineae bacterium]